MAIPVVGLGAGGHAKVVIEILRMDNHYELSGLLDPKRELHGRSMLGVPVLPPYYSLRLLPYVVPQISTWKRRMLREKDLMDSMY